MDTKALDKRISELATECADELQANGHSARLFELKDEFQAVWYERFPVNNVVLLDNGNNDY